MPRAKQKRGRRLEEKRDKSDAKRKREDLDEPSSSKRKKSLTESEDHIFLEGNTTGGAANDTPFYGLLDSNEQEYFSRVSELLELNRFQDAEERRLFLESVYEEAKGKELKIACSQSCSRLMEKLISMSNVHQTQRLFNKFVGHFLHLVQHRFASHCCEMLLIHAAPAVASESQKLDNRSLDYTEGEPELPLAKLFPKAIEELEGHWGYLLTERFASHTIRVLLLVLAGEPVDIYSNKSVIASRKKEKFVLTGGEPPADNAILQKRPVPDAFVDALKSVMANIISVFDDTYLRALATHPIGNPVLQVLLSLELTHFGKSSLKDPCSIIRRLIPEEPLTDGSQCAVFLKGLLYDPVGSRLLEVVIRHAPGKLFKNFHKNIIGDSIGTLARNDTAAYVVVRVLERIGKDDLRSNMELILPNISTLVERSRLVVPKVLIERCTARGVDTASLAEALASAYDNNPATRLDQLLKLKMSTGDGQAPRAQAKTNDQANANISPEKIHSSLLTQAMLRVPGALCELVYSSLLTASSETLLSIAMDCTTSHVIQQALTLPTSLPRFRRQFMPRFFGHMKELALDSSGSHVADVLWEATRDIFFVKERLAQELAQSEHVLRDSFFGRAVWRNWHMDLYKGRRGEWVQKAKKFDDQQAANAGADKKEIKSGIDLARARFAQNAERLKRMSGGQRVVATKS